MTDREKEMLYIKMSTDFDNAMKKKEYPKLYNFCYSFAYAFTTLFCKFFG